VGQLKYYVSLFTSHVCRFTSFGDNSRHEPVCCAGVPGTTMRGTVARRIATGTILTTGTIMWVFVSSNIQQEVRKMESIRLAISVNLRDDSIFKSFSY